MPKNDSVANVASASSQTYPTSQPQTSPRPSTPEFVSGNTSLSFPWILHHILDNNTAIELPLRIMFSFNAGQRLPSLKEVNKMYQYDPRGRKVIEFIASLPQEDLESGDRALNQFLGQNQELFFGGDNNTRTAPLGGLPISFAKSMCQRVFLKEYKQVDFDQALACLDYLRDLETSRRAALRDAALRLSINGENWRSILAEEPEAYVWVSKVQQQELVIESAYATVFVDLRIWTMIHELQSEPFYKPNVLAMLNTLFPPGLKHMPNDKVDVRRLMDYRNTFYKHIRAVDANGSEIIAEFVEKLLNPSTKHSWPETRRQLEEYLNLADTMIKEAKSIDGIEYFYDTSSVAHSRFSNARSNASERPRTASSANTTYDTRPSSSSSSKSPIVAFDASKVKLAHQIRGSNLFEADSFFEIPPLPSSAPVDPTKTPYVTHRELAASIITNENIAQSNSSHRGGRDLPAAGGLSIKNPAAVQVPPNKYSPTPLTPLVDGDMRADKRSKHDDEGTSCDPLSKANTKLNQPDSTITSKRGIFHGGFDFLNHPFQPGHASTEAHAPKLKHKKSITDIILHRKPSHKDLPKPNAHATSSESDTLTGPSRLSKLKRSDSLKRKVASSNATERTISIPHSEHHDQRSSPGIIERSVLTAGAHRAKRGSRPSESTPDQFISEATALPAATADDMGLGKVLGKLGKSKYRKYRKKPKCEKQARKDGHRVMAGRILTPTPEPPEASAKTISEEEAELNARKRAYLLGDHPRYGAPNDGSSALVANSFTTLTDNPYQLTSSEEYDRTQNDLIDLGFSLINPDAQDPDAVDQHIMNPNANPRSYAVPLPLHTKKSFSELRKSTDSQSTTRTQEDESLPTLEAQPLTESHKDNDRQNLDSQSPSKLHDDKTPSTLDSTSCEGRSPICRTPDSQSRKSSSPSFELNSELTYDSIDRRPDSSLSFDHDYCRKMVEIAKKRLAVRYAANPEEAYEDYRTDFVEDRRHEREMEARAVRADDEAKLAARLEAAKAEEREMKQQEIYRGMNEEEREAWNEIAILEGIKPRGTDGKTVEDYDMPEPDERYVMPTPEDLAAARKEREKPRLLLILKYMLRKNIEVFEDEWNEIFGEFGMTCEEVSVFARESGLIDGEGEEVLREGSQENSDLDDTKSDEYAEGGVPRHAASLNHSARKFESMFRESGVTEREFERFAKEVGWAEESEVGEHDANNHDISDGMGALQKEEHYEESSAITDPVTASLVGSDYTLDTRTKELQNTFEESGMSVEEYTEWLRSNDVFAHDELGNHEENEEGSVMSTTPYHNDSRNTRVKKLKKLYVEGEMTWEEFKEWLRETDMLEDNEEEETSGIDEHENGGSTSATGILNTSTEAWPAFIEGGMTANEIVQYARDNGLLDEHREGDGELESGWGEMTAEEVGEWARKNAVLEVEEQDGTVSSDATSQAYSLDTGTRDLIWYEDGELSGWIGFEKMQGPPGLISIGGRGKACSI